MARKLTVLAVVFFLLAFPALGLLWFWNDGHNRLRVSAIVSGQEILGRVLGDTSADSLADYGTLEFRESQGAEGYEQARKGFGKLVKLGELRAVHSESGSRRDHVWHFVTLLAEPQFENGKTKVRVTLARQTMAPDWRIEKLSIEQAQR